MSLTIRVSLLTLLALCPAVAAAGTFTLRPEVVAAYDPAFNPLPSFELFSPASAPVIYQIDVSFTVSDLAANETGFDCVIFDIELHNLTEAGAGGWQPNLAQVDVNGPDPGGLQTTYLINGDGDVPGDFQGMFVYLQPGPLGPSDPRRTIGQFTPALMGTFFVRWDGASPAWIDFNDISAVFKGLGGEQLQRVPFPNVRAPHVPEPASLAVAGVGLAALAVLRRRANRPPRAAGSGSV